MTQQYPTVIRNIINDYLVDADDIDEKRRGTAVLFTDYCEETRGDLEVRENKTHTFFKDEDEYCLCFYARVFSDIRRRHLCFGPPDDDESDTDGEEGGRLCDEVDSDEE